MDTFDLTPDDIERARRILAEVTQQESPRFAQRGLIQELLAQPLAAYAVLAATWLASIAADETRDVVESRIRSVVRGLLGKREPPAPNSAEVRSARALARTVTQYSLQLGMSREVSTVFERAVESEARQLGLD